MCCWVLDLILTSNVHQSFIPKYPSAKCCISTRMYHKYNKIPWLQELVNVSLWSPHLRDNPLFLVAHATDMIILLNSLPLLPHTFQLSSSSESTFPLKSLKFIPLLSSSCYCLCTDIHHFWSRLSFLTIFLSRPAVPSLHFPHLCQKNDFLINLINLLGKILVQWLPVAPKIKLK